MKVFHDPEQLPAPILPADNRALRVLLVLLIAAAAIAGCSALAIYSLGNHASDGRMFDAAPSSRPFVMPKALYVKPASDKAALRHVSAEQAEEINAAIPVSTAPNPAARPLIVPVGHALAWTRALDCMTAAIYYEAASESDEGQRAVAQVVLNRVRHPAFPNSVCGVVFQGSDRTTGCQFSFTCDGSLARIPARSAWDRARRLAGEALAGYVFDAVGLSTHYHTQWVSPYWAPTLTKTTMIGAHIFYRLPGIWGRPSAFSTQYAAQEPSITPAIANAAGIVDAKATNAPFTASEARPILSLQGKNIVTDTAARSPQTVPLFSAATPPSPAARGESRWIIENGKAE